MCYSIGFDLNHCCVQFSEGRCALPFSSEDYILIPCFSNWERQNDMKCLVTGGCTFAGGMVAAIGGWPWIITGAALGALGNLASYRYTRTTQEQLDQEANVRRLMEENILIKAEIAVLKAIKP